jgi:hypothetical protein
LKPIDGSEITGNQSRRWIAQEGNKRRVDVVNAPWPATILDNFRLMRGSGPSTDKMGVLKI